jgi:hypothetical protein
MPMNVKKIIKAVLVGFVLVSIGFAIGREVTLRRLAEGGGGDGAAGTAGMVGDGVVVYYMHPAARCATCNTIEKVARQAVEEGFAQDIRADRLRWRAMSIEDNEPLAKRYNVASSTVVVVRLHDGREVGHQCLDEAWELVDKPTELAACVSRAVRAALTGATTGATTNP